MTIEDGYAVRANGCARRSPPGAGRGHKIGLTSRAMQLSSQITEPDYGTLLDDMFFAEGGDIPFERFIAPRVEVELAFILGKPLRGPGVTLFDVLAATDWVVPAIEIIDARIEQFDRHTKAPRKVFDTIADNAANAGIVRRAPGAARRGGPALGERAAVQERRDRGVRAWPPRC
jgi:2-oxo-hept-3-ene-1,7-dioate hydratase